MDFANSFIGGGALKNGCVQEEIRFTICPELIVSMLVLEPMESNEAVLIKVSMFYKSFDDKVTSLFVSCRGLNAAPTTEVTRLPSLAQESAMTTHR